MAKQRFRENLDASAKSLKEALDLSGEAMNEAYAWGYSPFPTAKRLSDGTIEVTTYRFEGEWAITVCETELEVVHYLYTDGDGGWDAGTWV